MQLGHVTGLGTEGIEQLATLGYLQHVEVSGVPGEVLLTLTKKRLKTRRAFQAATRDLAEIVAHFDADAQAEIARFLEETQRVFDMHAVFEVLTRREEA